MKVTIDPTVNMAYIYLEENPVKGGSRNAKTYEVRDKATGQTSFVIDVDKDGRLIGIEVFDAQRRLPLSLMKDAIDISKEENDNEV